MTREEAVEVLKERYITCVGIGLDNHANRVNEAIDLAIEALQTIDNCDQCEWCCPSDGIPTIHVLRCKDCRYYNNDYMGKWCGKHQAPVWIKEDDFCSYGERQCNYFGERREP